MSLHGACAHRRRLLFSPGMRDRCLTAHARLPLIYSYGARARAGAPGDKDDAFLVPLADDAHRSGGKIDLSQVSDAAWKRAARIPAELEERAGACLRKRQFSIPESSIPEDLFCERKGRALRTLWNGHAVRRVHVQDARPHKIVPEALEGRREVEPRCSETAMFFFRAELPDSADVRRGSVYPGVSGRGGGRNFSGDFLYVSAVRGEYYRSWMM